MNHHAERQVGPKGSAEMESEWSPAGVETATIAAASASDNVARYIRGLIFSGELAPDDWLPPSRELAGRLGVSLVTLRVALKSLETMGYIVTSRGAHGGSRVSDVKTLRACWTRWLRESSDAIDDMFELRTTVETRIAWLAAERRTSAELEDIEAANRTVAETHSSVLRWNVAFHDAVARASRSPRLRRVAADVREELFLPVDLALREHRIVAIREDHAAIAEAIRDRDGERAAKSTREHIDSVRTLMRRGAA